MPAGWGLPGTGCYVCSVGSTALPNLVMCKQTTTVYTMLHLHLLHRRVAPPPALGQAITRTSTCPLTQVRCTHVDCGIISTTASRLPCITCRPLHLPPCCCPDAAGGPHAGCHAGCAEVLATSRRIARLMPRWLGKPAKKLTLEQKALVKLEKKAPQVGGAGWCQPHMCGPGQLQAGVAPTARRDLSTAGRRCLLGTVGV